MSDSKTCNLYVKESQSLPVYINNITSSSSLNMFLSCNNILTFTPSFRTTVSASSNTANIITFETPAMTSASNILIISGSHQDSTGRLKDSSFSSGGDVLYVGRDSVSTDKSWIPFDVSFGASGGIHLKSATLKLTSYDTQTRVDGIPCKIKIACDNVPNSASPTSWATLNSKTITPNFYSSTDLATWTQGTTYDIDLTTSAINLFGSASAITWTDGSRVGVILQDYGSSIGAYRSVVSAEGAINTGYQEPILELIYEDNHYEEDILDTFMYAGGTQTTNFSYLNSVQIGQDIPGYECRGLIKANLATISPLAIVTSASLILYLERTVAVVIPNYITAKRCLTNWDLYGCSWNKKYGTGNWGQAGCNQSGVDYESGSLAYTSINSTVGAKTIPLDTAKVQEWISGSVVNNGMVVSFPTGAKSYRQFTSSRGSVVANRPKIVVDYTLGGTPYTTTFQNTG